MEDKIVEENIEVNIGMKIKAEKEVAVGLGKDHFQGILMIEGTIEDISNSRPRSGSRGSTKRDKIMCYKCKKYDHFANKLSHI